MTNNHPPDSDAPQRTEDDDKALIQTWKQKEKDINAVLISVRELSIVYRGLAGHIDDDQHLFLLVGWRNLFQRRLPHHE
jgi:hypothetical protein